MRWLIFLIVWPCICQAQSSVVLPHQLKLEVQIEARNHTPLVREMVVLNIRGIYRRHITRETLVQPDFDGFSWSQLGPDTWSEERLDGQKVKVFSRRMAIYPERAGALQIDAFRHRLTLTDEADEWFEHDILSVPIVIDVLPIPQEVSEGAWWFPVRRLEVSDQWSNAPDQLKPGEGVLRIIRLDALGVTPEMIPPMPELSSPSASIFPHPEKRLVELTPEGPLTHAFWRWTIRPSNDVSTIVEPLSFSYYDTELRGQREVTVSAQRVAYGNVTGTPAELQNVQLDDTDEAVLPGLAALVVGAVVLVSGTLLGLRRREWAGLSRLTFGDPQKRALYRAARAGDAVAFRQKISNLAMRDGPDSAWSSLLHKFDRAYFDPTPKLPDLNAFLRDSA